jgi:hypothetical protein
MWANAKHAPASTLNLLLFVPALDQMPALKAAGSHMIAQEAAAMSSECCTGWLMLVMVENRVNNSGTRRVWYL